jgi:hypothetical protein
VVELTPVIGIDVKHQAGACARASSRDWTGLS